MKLIYKIDANRYASLYFPVALYRMDRGWFGRVKWVHLESYQTVAAAQADLDKVTKDLPDLPIYSSKVAS